MHQTLNHKKIQSFIVFCKKSIRNAHGIRSETGVGFGCFLRSPWALIYGRSASRYTQHHKSVPTRSMGTIITLPKP